MKKLFLVLMIAVGPAVAFSYDPTLPYSGEEKKISSYSSDSELNVQAVIYGSTKKIAIVNEKLVHVGDVVNDYKIIRIDPKSVVFVKNRKSKTVHVYQVNAEK